jgi:hypothetical protein
MTYSVYNLEINNNLVIQSGVTAGYILTTDGSGGTYWSAPQKGSTEIYYQSVSRSGATTSAQNWFDNSIPFEGSSTYSFTGFISMSSQGSTTHSVGISINVVSGTVTNILWNTIGTKAILNFSGTVPIMTHRNFLTIVTSTGANSVTGSVARIEGYMTTGSAGSFNPQFSFSAAPGATSFTASSYFEMTKI